MNSVDEIKKMYSSLKFYQNISAQLKRENFMLKQKILRLESENKELKDKTDSFLRLLVRNNKKISELNLNLNKKDALINELESKIRELKNFSVKKSETRSDELLNKLKKEIEKQKTTIHILEEMNKRLIVQLNLEREEFKKRLMFDKNIFVNEKTKKIKEEKNISFIDLEPTEDTELNDIKAMVNIALQNGNSIENIRASLINAGYKKEKIEKVIY